MHKITTINAGMLTMKSIKGQRTVQGPRGFGRHGAPMVAVVSTKPYTFAGGVMAAAVFA